MNVVREIKLMQGVSDRDHVRGPSTASITVVHYGDFECPFSREGARVMKVIEGQFDGQLRIVFRHLATHAHTERIRADVLSGQQSGVTGTPTFFINGQRYEGSDDLPSLMAAMRLTPAIK